MKKSLIITLLYILGCVFAYKYWKYNATTDFSGKVWTKADRRIAVVASFGSWFTVVAMGIVHIERDFGGDGEKANW